MKITKYNHSCLLVEDAGKRLLIDPGAWSFGEGLFAVEDVGAVDVILLTHEHRDHTDIDILKQFVAVGDTAIVTHDNLAVQLEDAGLVVQRIALSMPLELAGFTIRAYGADHGPLPVSVPHNIAYVINGRLCHPGDSLRVEELEQIEILALPVGAPWMRAVDAVEMVERLNPKHVLPIHDSVFVPQLRTRVVEMLQTKLSSSSVTMHPLGDNGAVDL